MKIIITPILVLLIGLFIGNTQNVKAQLYFTLTDWSIVDQMPKKKSVPKKTKKALKTRFAHDDLDYKDVTWHEHDWFFYAVKNVGNEQRTFIFLDDTLLAIETRIFNKTKRYDKEARRFTDEVVMRPSPDVIPKQLWPLVLKSSDSLKELSALNAQDGEKYKVHDFSKVAFMGDVFFNDNGEHIYLRNVYVTYIDSMLRFYTEEKEVESADEFMYPF